MKRLVLMSLVLIYAVGFAASPEELLKKRYFEYNRNILRSDGRAMTKWMNTYSTSDFTYTSYQKNTYKHSDYVTGLLQQIAQTNKVLKSTLMVRSFKKSGKDIVATVATDFKGVVVVDSRKLTLTDQSVTFETWEFVNHDWKLKKIVQVNADPQMHEDEGSLSL